MRTVKQGRKDGNCMAACAAMLTNTTIQNFIDEIGEAHAFCGKPGKSLQGYTDYDLALYLLAHKRSPDITHIRKSGIDLRKNTTTTKREYGYKGLDAYVTVRSQKYTRSCFKHAVVWDSKAKCVRDPNPLLPTRRKLSDYTILFWTPIYNIQ